MRQTSGKSQYRAHVIPHITMKRERFRKKNIRDMTSRGKDPAPKGNLAASADKTPVPIITVNHAGVKFLKWIWLE
ncbi:hypothetical protein H0H92_001957 [Tricholoma furcatifolium]|nr:hypothetical protein H0H92_001957 [Tricholoma furcatifolium]